MRIEVLDSTLGALDTLDVDGLLVFVGPERPLQGLAGLADWRLCGAISRALRTGVFEARPEEALLLPSQGRLGASRIFCFGLPEVPLRPEAFLHATRAACEAVARAGSEAFASALPLLAGGSDATAARLWLEASLARPIRRQVLLGDARSLERHLVEARDAMGVEVDVVAPRTEALRPGRALPQVGGVVR